MEVMRYFSAFTGALGFELGLPKEWECVGVSEIDSYAVKLIRYRKGDVKNYGDIEKIKYEELPDFEVLVGGSPCQDISVAGKRVGLSGVRSRLFFSYITILKVKKPDYFIFENVKGLLSSNGGWDFARVQIEFSEAGYDVWWQVLNATQFGIPQHRERVFIVGAFRGRKASIRKVFFRGRTRKENIVIQKQRTNTITRKYRESRTGGSYIIESEFKAQETAPQPVADLKHKNPRRNGRLVKKPNEPSFTLQVMERQGVLVNGRIRFLTPLECERLMGWKDEWTRWGVNDKGRVVELSDNMRYKLIGNGVVPQIVSNIVENIIKWS